VHVTMRNCRNVMLSWQNTCLIDIYNYVVFFL